MSYLIDACGDYIDLSYSAVFGEHSANKNNCTDFIIDEINTSHIYDEFFPYIKDGVVLDIGANVGLFSLFICSLAKQVYSVEPTPSHTNVFQDILTTYSIENIKLNRCAISKSTGLIQFSLTTNSTMNSVAEYGNSYDPKITVPVYTLDDFLKLNGIESVDFMKMDIEGSEKDVFDDLTLKNALEKIKSLYIELHPLPKMDYDKMMEFLNSLGYTIKQFHRENHLHAIFATRTPL